MSSALKEPRNEGLFPKQWILFFKETIYISFLLKNQRKISRFYRSCKIAAPPPQASNLHFPDCQEKAWETSTHLEKAGVKLWSKLLYSWGAEAGPDGTDSTTPHLPTWDQSHICVLSGNCALAYFPWRRKENLLVFLRPSYLPTSVTGIHLGKLHSPYLYLLLPMETYQMVVSPAQTPVVCSKIWISFCA